MYKTVNNTYVSFRPGHKDFAFSPDGITLVPRASVVINEQCPDSYRSMIAYAINNGWVEPIANMRDSEYTMEVLRK